ncbi:MAG TPA: CRTAC1 family protein [Bryobacteraceae bacterium]|nr:CRTAC1 family protein [Bryobacteraceae bacterium]
MRLGIAVGVAGVSAMLFGLRAAPPPTDIHFTDVTAAAGIHFTHNAGRTGKKWLPETMGSGVAFFDADGDGHLDILLLNGSDWIPRAGHRTVAALYRNNGKGAFADVTRGSGLDIQIHGMGVAVGDYDNDGRDDLYITAVGGDHLFRNLGGGHFRDVTRQSGIANAQFSSSSAWLDYDKDGKLDLFVGNYVQWSEKGDIRCSLDGTNKSYCTPELYKGAASKLYRNLGNGRFEDVTAKAGLNDASSKTLGVTVFDFNRDAWPDLFLANDTQPNKLYRNLGNGTFREEGLAAGVAFGEDGVARGAMGTDAADYDRSGRQHLAVGNFTNQMLALYHNDGNGLFSDLATRAGIGRPSQLSLTFGLFFFDYDLDGLPDIFAANGHLEEDITKVQPKIQYAQLPLLFHNAGGGKFDNVTGAFRTPLVARGAAYGDYDGDGDLDVLVSSNNAAAHLYRNDGGNARHWLQLRLAGTKSNKDGIGAVVRVASSQGKQEQTVHSGSSYCSSSDLALTFGLGGDASASVEVDWPSGKHQKLENVKVNQRMTVTEN